MPWELSLGRVNPCSIAYLLAQPEGSPAVVIIPSIQLVDRRLVQHGMDQSWQLWWTVVLRDIKHNALFSSIRIALGCISCTIV